MKKLVALLLINCFFGTLAAEIRYASSFKELRREFESLDRHCLVVFDVDKVLLMPKDAMGHPHAKAYRKELKKELVKEHGNAYHRKWSQFLLQAEQGPVEAEILSIIKRLQAKGVRVMVCTAKGQGSYGDIRALDTHRLKQLQHAGYDFSDTFATFSPLTVRTKRGPRVFRDGILFAGGAPKGKVLRTFLEEVEFHPRRVLFFDDKMKNVRSVHKAMQKWDVEVTCVCYSGAEKRPQSFDEKMLEKQSRYFVKRGIWLNDHDVR
jgi:hypothetical protein